jgi:cation:H+ antiporter
MAAAILQFFIAAGVIVIAGTALTHFADTIADLTRLGRLLVGSLFLAGATSLPELMVDLNAIGLGLPDLAVGDLMGSSLCNLLILAVLDMSRRSQGRMLSRLSAAHALSAALSIVLTAIVVISLLLAGRLARFDFGGIRIANLAILLAYVLGTRLIFYNQRIAARHGEDSPQAVSVPAWRAALLKAIAGYLIAADALLIAAPFLAEAAGQLAELTGLGNTFIGTTLVALSTSLPELVASLAAVRMGAFDLAIASIFGSNSFNMVLLLPLDMAYPGALLAAVSATHAVTGLFIILVTALAVMGQLYQVERRIALVEPDALLVILLVLGALATIYYLR